MLHFKNEVRIGVLRWQLTDMLEVLCDWSLLHRIDVHVASVNDSLPLHQAHTLHQFDLALDCNPDTMAPQDRESLAEYLRRWLPPQYDLVLENDHIHVEWDAHRPALLKQTST